MANLASSAQRATFATFANSTLGACPRWDAALTEYVQAEALMHACAEYGPLAHADDKHGLAIYEAQATYGKRWEEEPVAKSRVDALFDEQQEQNDLWVAEYVDRCDKAAAALAFVPAPTIAAATFKAWLIDSYELWNTTDIDDDCMQIVRDDFDRFTGDTSRHREWADMLERFNVLNDAGSDAELDEAGDLLRKIMASPAPDAAAAQWKLDWFFSDGNDHTACYSKAYLA